MNADTADYIIVGAGSAGCVLANRLSLDASVILLEAGPADHAWDFRLHMPAALSHVLANDTYNWFYSSEPEQSLNGRAMYCPRGRVLGGSSSINGMIFVRGHADDFNGWAQEHQLPDWRYEACLPYFKKSETCLFADSEFRGAKGPMSLSRGTLQNPLFNAWLSGAAQAGHPVTEDFNGASQEGAGAFDRTIHAGARQSVARAYLHPVLARKNLAVMTRTLVNRIVFDHGRAIAVECQVGRKNKTLRANKEIIICGGAINSPQLLMLSGVGEAQALAQVAIDTVVDLPGVGKNLMDHLEVYLQFACLKPVSIYPATRWFNQPFVGLQWYLARQGPCANNHFETGAFLRSSDEVSYPDLQFHFLPIAMDYDGKNQYPGHGFQAHVGPMKPTSRGDVSLRSSNTAERPRIRFNYNASAEDRAVMRSGIRKAREIVAQAAFDDYRGVELRPGVDVESDAALDEFVRRHGESAYHPSGTCKMGVDQQSVVNSDGLVHGVQGLRVVDASIMPEITNGNLNAPVIMMAEKISDAILAGR